MTHLRKRMLEELKRRTSPADLRKAALYIGRAGGLLLRLLQL
jgi:hypothetical protein